jgi:large subunit ribosomal protein L32
MGAVPKSKTSKARRDSRRASNFRLGVPNLAECPQCHKPKLSHTVCPECGFYKGKQVVAIQE